MKWETTFLKKIQIKHQRNQVEGNKKKVRYKNESIKMNQLK